MVAPCGGLELSGRNMDEQISNFLQRRSVAFSLEYPLSKDQLWQLISRGGNLNECHPFCLANDVINWDENSNVDKLVYLNGLTYIRRFLNWNEGEGYDLLIGKEEGRQSYVNWEISQIDENKVEQEIEDDNEDSILNPETQKLTAKEIYRQIVDEKMSLDDDSYFDDMITLYVAKQIVSMKTDEEILTLLLRLKDTGADETYYEKKIHRARVKFKIEDPEIARAELLKNVIYIKQRDKFFDLTTNEEYDKSAINFTYAIVQSIV
mgnify:CR=1 FL=1